MPLPKLNYPLNEIHVSSLGKKVNYRPMLTSDEKLLLIAKESKNDADIFRAIKQIVNNCIVDDGVDVDKLPLFELEYFFLVLRIKSIGGMVSLSYRDSEDGKDYQFNINLDDIILKHPEETVSKKIALTKDVGVVMKYPPASLYDNEIFMGSDNVSEVSEELLVSCIDKVYDQDNVYDMKDADRKEIGEFLDSIDTLGYKKMQEFLSSVPHMHYIIEYKNSKGTERKVELRTLTDFFIL